MPTTYFLLQSFIHSIHAHYPLSVTVIRMLYSCPWPTFFNSHTYALLMPTCYFCYSHAYSIHAHCLLSFYSHTYALFMPTSYFLFQSYVWSIHTHYLFWLTVIRKHYSCPLATFCYRHAYALFMLKCYFLLQSSVFFIHALYLPYVTVIRMLYSCPLPTFFNSHTYALFILTSYLLLQSYVWSIHAH